MIPAGLRNTDGATTGNGLTTPASAIYSDLSAGSIFAWVMPSSVANSLRNIAGKSVTNGGWEWYKRGVDGTVLQFGHYRGAGSSLTITSASGTLKANIPQFFMVSWDLSTSANCKLWGGTLVTPAADLSATVSMGTGSAASDASRGITISNSVGGSAGWPDLIWTFGISGKADYSLAEVRQVQRDPFAFRNALGLWIFDEMPARDWSGNGNVGALVGTGRLSSDCLPRVRRRRDR